MTESNEDFLHLVAKVATMAASGYIDSKGISPSLANSDRYVDAIADATVQAIISVERNAPN
jgi:hypothetical protein